MNKLFSKIAALSVGLAMAVGVGFALGHQSVKEAKAAEVLEYTLDGTDSSQGDNGYASVSEVTQGGVGWEVTANTKINPWRFGGKNLNDIDRTAASTVAVSSKDIIKVEVVVGSATATVNSVSLWVGSSKGASDIGTLSKTSGLTSTTLVFSRPSNEDWAGKFFTIVFNVDCGGSNQYVQMTSAKFYKESSATLQSISVTPSSISGYVTGSSFGTTELRASGVSVMATYDSGDPIDVTSNAEVSSAVTLVSGENIVVVSFGGKNANLTVNAKTQEQYDTEAAAAVDALITSIDMTKTGYALVNTVRDVYMEYAKLNANAQSKVQYKSIYDNNVNSDSNYILFLNSLASDSSTKIEGDSPTVPGTWHVPSTLSIKSASFAYDGKESTLKFGNSSNAGSLTIELNDKSYSFTKVAVGTTIYGTDTGKVTMSGTETQVTPTAGGAEVEPIDISAAKLTEITVGTTEKRAYIDYIYVEYEKNEDVLDSNIIVSGTLTKSVYTEGESFDPSGLSFSVSYNEDPTNTKAISASDIVWSPSPLTTGIISVTGTYTEGLATATCTINGLTVNPYVVTNYGQVGQPLSDYSGTYYFYNSDSSKIWKATDPTNAYSSIDATVTSNVIASSVLLDEGAVILEKVDGGYYIKNANGKYVGPNTSGLASGVVNAAVLEAGSLHTVVSVGDDGVVTMSATYGTNTTVYLRFNSASNQLKVRYYEDASKVKGVVLFKAGASAVKTNLQEVDAFVSGYMHPEISYEDNSDTNACRAEGEGAENYYGLASTAFNELSERQRQLFVSEEAYANPYARLQAWATANGQEFNSSNLLVPSAAESFYSVNDMNNNSYIIIIVISAVSVMSFGLALFLRKKRSK